MAAEFLLIVNAEGILEMADASLKDHLDGRSDSNDWIGLFSQSDRPKISQLIRDITNGECGRGTLRATLDVAGLQRDYILSIFPLGFQGFGKLCILGRSEGMQTQSQQMCSILITHDVANYNVPIHGFLEMLVKDPKLDERQRRYVRSSLTQSENISTLISDLRRLMWLNYSERDHILRPIDIIPLLQEVVETFNGHILYGTVEFWTIFEAEQAWVDSDIFLKDMFYNILSNACKHGETMPVRLSVRRSDVDGRAYWRIEVEDRGHGIPDDRKMAIFNRFDQIESDSAAEGHGLGLSVVSALTKRYGGRVWVENRIADDWSKGSRFVVLLPISDKQ